MLLPESWGSYYPIHVYHSRGVHGDVVARERLDVPHLRQNGKSCDERQTFVEQQRAPLTSLVRTFPEPNDLPLK